MKKIPREGVSQTLFFLWMILLPLQTVWLWRVPMIDGEKWQYGTIGLYATDVLLIGAVMCFILFKVGSFGLFAFSPLGLFGRNFSDGRPRMKPMNTSIGFIGSEVGKSSSKSSIGERRIDRNTFVGILLTVFIFFSGLSIFWAADSLLAGYFFAKLLLVGIVLWLAGSMHVFDTTKKSFRWVWIGIIAVAVGESFLGVGQFLTQTTFASKWLGMSGYEAWQPGVSVLKNESGRWLRAYGTFPHPNIFGLYLAVVLVGLVGFCVFHYDKKKMTWVLGIISVLLLGLIVSFSRAAWLGVALGISLISFDIFFKGSIGQKKRLVKILGGILLSGVVFVNLLFGEVFPRFESATIDREGSIVERMVLAKQSKAIIQDHFWLGVGAGNYTLAVMRKYPDLPLWAVQPVHNVPLLIWAELGIVGLVLFAGLIILAFAVSWKQKNTAWLAVFVVLLPSLFLDHFLWDSHFGIIFLALIPAIVIEKINT